MSENAKSKPRASKSILPITPVKCGFECAYKQGEICSSPRYNRSNKDAYCRVKRFTPTKLIEYFAEMNKV